MTNQQILTKAIQKAIDGGWDVDLETVLPEMLKKWSLYGLKYTGYSGLLFSKDFAKALWGERRVCLTCGSTSFMSTKINKARTGYTRLSANTPAKHALCMGCECSEPAKLWQYHLQQMVIADDPIAYLGENI